MARKGAPPSPVSRPKSKTKKRKPLPLSVRRRKSKQYRKLSPGELNQRGLKLGSEQYESRAGDRISKRQYQQLQLRERHGGRPTLEQRAINYLRGIWERIKRVFAPIAPKRKGRGKGRWLWVGEDERVSPKAEFTLTMERIEADIKKQHAKGLPMTPKAHAELQRMIRLHGKERVMNLLGYQGAQYT